MAERARIQLTSTSEEATQAIGRVLGLHARPGDVFLLAGDLGAGKTCLTQGILWGLGGDEYARSPTFVLVSQYRGRLTLYHIDLFRLDSIEEIADLELEEYLLGDGVCAVEWAQKARQMFPEHSLTVQIDYVDANTRRLAISAGDRRYDEIMEALRSMAD